MKKFLFTSLLLISGVANSQQIINATDLTIQEGEIYKMKSRTWVSLPQGSTAQNWDLSGSSSSNTTSATAIATTVAGATIGLQTQDNAVEHYAITSSAISLVKVDLPNGMAFNYSDPRKIVELPLEYGNSHTDTYAHSAPGGASISGTLTANVNGHGTMILDMGTFENVLRVLTNETITTTVPGQPTSTTQRTEEKYYVAGVKQPIAVLAMQSVNGGNASSSAWVMYETNLALEQANNLVFVIAPNPTENGFTIVGAQEIETIELIDMSGKIIPANFDSSNNYVNISQLTPGAYTLRVVTNNGVSVQRVMKR